MSQWNGFIRFVDNMNKRIHERQSKQYTYGSYLYIRKGMTFGRLTTEKPTWCRRTHQHKWICSCSCEEGRTTNVSPWSLKIGNTKSCGCLGEQHRREHLKSFYKPTNCKECGVEYITNTRKETRGLCPKCNGKLSKREWAARNRQKKRENALNNM